jgi:hypothetical protein
VPRIASRRFVLALVAFALPASLFAAPSDPAETPAKPSLKGQLLIATPAMRDPRFEHAVILMVRHGQDGALGIVINRPLGEQPLADLLAALGAKDIAAVGSVRVFLGGPVQPEIGFVVHSSGYHRPDTIAVRAHRRHVEPRDPARHCRQGRPDEKSHCVRLCRLGRPVNSRANSPTMSGIPRQPIRASCSTMIATRCGSTPPRTAPRICESLSCACFAIRVKTNPSG